MRVDRLQCLVTLDNATRLCIVLVLVLVLALEFVLVFLFVFVFVLVLAPTGCLKKNRVLANMDMVDMMFLFCWFIILFWSFLSKTK